MTKRIKLGSLFSGIGGIDLAFERAGFEIAFQVEIDEFCNKVLTKHWPSVPKFGDIRTVKGSDLPAIDVLAGGFPCQDISIAGRGEGIQKGNRSGLWFEFARLIGETLPAVVMLENVAAITSRDGTYVLAGLTQMGYDAEWGVIPASAAGAPHKRERWFCVAYRNNGQCLREKQTVCAGRHASDISGNELAYAPNGSRTDISQMSNGSTLGSAITDSSNRTIGGNTSTGIFVDRRTERDLENPNNWRLETKREVIQSVNPAPNENRQTNRTEYASGWSTQSVLGRATDGLSRQLDGHRWPSRPGEPQGDHEPPRTVGKGIVPNRTSRLKALGNAVVPQVVYPIAVAIKEMFYS